MKLTANQQNALKTIRVSRTQSGTGRTTDIRAAKALEAKGLIRILSCDMETISDGRGIAGNRTGTKCATCILLPVMSHNLALLPLTKATTVTTTDKLAKLTNRATRYEALLCHPEHRSLLVGYSARKSFPGLVGLLRIHADTVCSLFTDPGLSFTKEGQDIVLCGGWSVKFSGRTQRTAICNGERPCIGTVTPADFQSCCY
tara:strand:- start:3532 stop:4134 length:603 start_codon:yes stop_codon:yes gene_type:complete